jgi:hypothetical protein
LQHSAPARIQDEIYLFFLPPAFFFFATVGALLSIVVSQEPQFLPLDFPIYDILYFFPPGNGRKFSKIGDNPRGLGPGP